MHTKLRRSVAAIATTLACLALMAGPASATPHGAAITGGNIVLTATNTFVLTFPWGGTAGTGCGSTLVIDEDATAGTYEITSYTGTSRISFLGSPFIAVLTRTASAAGTYSGTALNFSSSLTLRIDIYNPANADPATDCGIGTQVCRLRTTLHLAGTLTGWTASGTGSLAWPSTIALASAPPACSPLWSSFYGSTVSTGSFSFHITS